MEQLEDTSQKDDLTAREVLLVLQPTNQYLGIPVQTSKNYLYIQCLYMPNIKINGLWQAN